MTGSPLTTTLALSVLPAAGPGQTFILTGALSPASSSGYTASGTVTFLDGGVLIGAPVALFNGSATLSKSDFAKGTHSIIANYSGDANFLPESSSVVTASVIPDYAIAANPSALTIRRGQNGTSSLTLTPTVGFTGQVTFSCAGLPQFTTCSFSPATLMLPGDNAAHTVQLSLLTPASNTTATNPALALLMPLGFLALASRSRRNRAAKMLAVLMVALALAGCGSGLHQVPLGTSTITVTASTADGSTHHSAAITVTIGQ